MPLIRQAEAAARGARPFNLEDLNQRAEKYLEHVRNQARQILLEAKQQAQAQRAQLEAEVRGQLQQQFQQQVAQEVQAQLNQRVQTLLPALQQVVEQLARARSQWLEHWQQNALRVAVAMAEKIVRRQLEQQPDIPLQWVQEALEAAAGSPQVVVRMNPRDVESLGQQVEQLARQLLPAAQFRLESDPTVEPAGAVVHTAWGEVDQQLGTQLQRLLEELE